jgi:hypothetical protein
VGEIERRLLVNYRVEPAQVQALLPAPFRPHLVDGHAVAGICLIRLGSLRPVGIPAVLGRRSENAAHRIAVEWDTADGVATGVYIPRRDSESWLTVAVGGRLFPGHHHRARFTVEETSDDLHVALAAEDGSVQVDVRVRVADRITGSRLFPTVEEASAFFERGAVGWSAAPDGGVDGLRLETSAWRVEPVDVVSGPLVVLRRCLRVPARSGRARQRPAHAARPRPLGAAERRARPASRSSLDHRHRP